MQNNERADLSALGLPAALLERFAGCAVHDSSGMSGARTVFIDKDGGQYLKIAERGSLARAAVMQRFFAQRGVSPPVLTYISDDRDYMVTAAAGGQDGTSPMYIAQPERLAAVFGRCLRALHGSDVTGCPVPDRMSALLEDARGGSFRQSHLDDIAPYIGKADARDAAAEIAATRGLIRHDALIHGDYCLPNIMLDDWAFTGYIDVADGGVGDRHYDLAWGLWTLHYNLKDPGYGRVFLDAYGRDVLDTDRLRVCGLLVALGD